MARTYRDIQHAPIVRRMRHHNARVIETRAAEELTEHGIKSGRAARRARRYGMPSDWDDRPVAGRAELPPAAPRGGSAAG